MDRDGANGARFARGEAGGFYESWFIRANHPGRRLAFWARATVFCPRGAPERAVGQIWAIWFDGERDRVVAVKEDHPIERCRFDARRLDVVVGESTLTPFAMRGAASRAGHRLAWDLGYEGADAPLLLLPASLYRGPFPKTKTVTASPRARFSGTLEVDGEVVAIDAWPGSQSHNWGTSQTDAYAWAQVAGFDGAEESVLECISARVGLVPGLPFRTPRSTLLVLRHEGRELAFRGPLDWVRTRARWSLGDYALSARRGDLAIDVRVTAKASAFVGLTYENPSGGAKICLNTKLARAEVTISEGGRTTRLSSAHRAALEIVGDASLGVPLAV